MIYLAARSRDHEARIQRLESLVMTAINQSADALAEAETRTLRNYGVTAQARIEELETALREIADFDPVNMQHMYVIDHMRMTAKSALNEETG